MVNPVTPIPKPTSSFTSGVSCGRPGTHGQLSHTPMADRPDVTIGFATSDQYPQSVNAMAMLTMLPTTFAEISMIAMRRNCMARRISA